MEHPKATTFGRSSAVLGQFECAEQQRPDQARQPWQATDPALRARFVSSPVIRHTLAVEASGWSTRAARPLRSILSLRDPHLRHLDGKVVGLRRGVERHGE